MTTDDALDVPIKERGRSKNRPRRRILPGKLKDALSPRGRAARVMSNYIQWITGVYRI